VGISYVSSPSEEVLEVDKVGSELLPCKTPMPFTSFAFCPLKLLVYDPITRLLLLCHVNILIFTNWRTGIHLYSMKLFVLIEYSPKRRIGLRRIAVEVDVLSLVFQKQRRFRFDMPSFHSIWDKTTSSSPNIHRIDNILSHEYLGMHILQEFVHHVILQQVGIHLFLHHPSHLITMVIAALLPMDVEFNLVHVMPIAIPLV
jgi:hypothetical protein